MRDILNVVVGKNEEEVYILESIFDHGDGFTGATGSIVHLLTEEEYEERITAEALEDYFEEAWRNDAGRVNGTELGLSDWVAENEEELAEAAVELYYGIDFGDGIYAEVIGCGRIFRDDWEDNMTELYEPELRALIKKAEARN